MKTEIQELATYYQKFHHTLVDWSIKLSGFVFVALLAADVTSLKENAQAVYGIWVAIVAFPLVFVLAIGQFGERIERLNAYMKLSDTQIPASWFADHKRRGFTLSGAGTFYFITIVIGQAVVNGFLAWSRL